MSDNDLEKIQTKRKESLITTIGNTFWRALEDLGQAMVGTKKRSPRGRPIITSKDQISLELDKYENERFKK